MAKWLGIGVAALAIAGVTLGVVLASGGGAKDAGTDPTPSATLSVAASSEPTPSPSTTTTEYPADPVTGREPIIFELTAPLPADLQELDAMDPDTEFANQPMTDRLREWSWLAQRQDDFNARFVFYNSDGAQANILDSQPSPNDSAVDILARFYLCLDLSYTFADWSTGENPPPIDLDRAEKVVYALYEGTRESNPTLDFVLTNLENLPHYADVSTLANGNIGVVTTEEIEAGNISRSDPYETTDGYTAVDITRPDDSGGLIVVTFIFPTFTDFEGNTQTALVYRSSHFL